MFDNCAPFVSIIVPVYNAGESLTHCLDSILSQTIKKTEIILIDDGSTDRSPAICDEYAKIDSRIKVIHQKNGGASNARNKGIENAQGDWLYFIDSDDWIEPLYLENFMFRSENKDLVIQGYQYDRENKQDMVCYDEFVSESSEQIIRHLFETKYSLVGVIWNKLYKRDIIINHHIRFDSDIHFAEDAIFFFEYLKYTNNTQVLSTTGYHYNLTNNGLTGKRHSTEYYLKILSLFIERLDNLNISQKFRNKYIWNALEYWLIYPNMKYAYDEFEFDNLYHKITTFCNKNQLWNAPKLSFTSVCLGWALRCNNSRKKYKYIKFIHLYIRRSENRIRGFFNKDFKKI